MPLTPEFNIALQRVVDSMNFDEILNGVLNDNSHAQNAAINNKSVEEEPAYQINTLAAVKKEIAFSYHNKLISHFDSLIDKNQMAFQEVRDALTNHVVKVYCAKKTENLLQFVIPIEEKGVQIELVALYNDSKFIYNLKHNKWKLTRVFDQISLPSPEFCLVEECSICFVSEDETYNDFMAFAYMAELNTKIGELELAPQSEIENQQEIWTKYIEAQKLILNDLQKPFECTGDISPLVKREKDGNVKSYSYSLSLIERRNPEYEDFEEELQNKLSIDAEFQNDGTVMLTYNNIIMGLDAIIKKRFSNRLERDVNIGCILKVKSLNLYDQINDLLECCNCSMEKSGYYFLIESDKVDEFSLDEVIFSNFGLEKGPDWYDYEISGIENNDLYLSPHVGKFNISFGAAQYKKNVQEIILPQPLVASEVGRAAFRERILINPNTNEEVSQEFLYQTLCWIYGKENVKRTRLCSYKAMSREKLVGELSDELLAKLAQHLYALDFDVTIGNSIELSERNNTRTLYFDFTDIEDLKEKYAKIASFSDLKIVKSPLDADFKFKVRTTIIAEKSQKQLFEEKLRKLSGTPFIAEKKDDTIFIGKLVGRESSMSKLTFSVPNYTDKDKKLVKDLLKFLESNPIIKSVKPDLRGEVAQTIWLQDAMNKLSETSSTEPNKTAVNPKLKDFIFDSSKATPNRRYELTDIEKTPEYVHFDRTSILNLNESQKKAVLRALYSEDLCLLQGPPGTGKTSVIAELIWQHVRTNQLSRLLLTSETNLAVDNALEKLMNEKIVNPALAKYITLIKPLRFGKSTRFEEEGKRFSFDRILKWVDGSEDDYEDEGGTLEEEEENNIEENNEGSIEDNAVHNWMLHIADRSLAHDPRYSEALKDWVIELSMPGKAQRQYFRDKYMQYVNVVGSTCSSTGSKDFQRKYYKSFVPEMSNSVKALYEILYLINKAAKSKKLTELLIQQGLYEMDGVAHGDYSLVRDTIYKTLHIHFDTVIMDEASKATPPQLLLPLCFGKKSIVIGDHRQLPPMLYDKDFREALLALNNERATQLSEEIDREFVETSQFKRLILNRATSDTIKSTFNLQYRMHPRINNVIKQFYQDDDGGLSCGLDPIKVESSDLNESQSRYHGFAHDGFINDRIHTIWVNVEAPEEKDGTSTVNPTEVEAVKKVLQYLKHSHGFEEYMSHWDLETSEAKRRQEKEIGVISFYGRQKQRLRDVYKTANKLNIPIRINTVDKFQGMERNIVIVSTVRSNRIHTGNGFTSENNNAGFANSPERLNVALSRARRLLIIVGNMNFFYHIKDSQGKYLYQNAIDEISKHGKIIEYKDLQLYDND